MKKPNKLRTLIKKADKLYQIKMIKEQPYSVISGEPTEVIHHFIPKGQSNSLRYNALNGVPLTNGEHCRHHKSGDPEIVLTIEKTRGQEWVEYLQQTRRIICKFNIGYLNGIIEQLK